MVKKKALLTEEKGKDVLQLNLVNGTVNIDFNSTDQTSLRNVFYAIINNILQEDFEFELDISEGYKKQLYIDIAQEYLKQLNTELKSIKEQAKQDFHTL